MKSTMGDHESQLLTITKTGGIDYGELGLLLLELSLDDLDFRELVELLVVASAVIFRSGELG
jgi:hypothetical protein